MVRIYAVWLEGATEASILAIKQVMVKKDLSWAQNFWKIERQFSLKLQRQIARI
jgi:hypothetical protein